MMQWVLLGGNIITHWPLYTGVSSEVCVYACPATALALPWLSKPYPVHLRHLSGLNAMDENIGIHLIIANILHGIDIHVAHMNMYIL